MVQQQLPSTAQKKQMRRSIHFSRHVHVKVIPSRLEHTANHSSIWYTNEEFAAQSKECVQCVRIAKDTRKMHERGEDPTQVSVAGSAQMRSDTTIRGLEHLLSKATLARRKIEQRSSIDAVLVAQENDVLPDDVAVIYANRTRHSKTRALRLGEMDAEEAGATHKTRR